MNIELKNVHINERMSEETTMFQADIFINGKKAGYAENLGHGGSTDYHAYNAAGRQLLEEAEAYCRTLPDKVNTLESDGKTSTYSIKMTLEHLIDDLLDSYMKKKDQQAFEKIMEKSIVWGVPGANSYWQQKFKHPIATMLETPSFRAAFKNSLLKTILPEMKEGEKILNTNIHPDELVSLGIPKDRTIEQAVTVKRHTGGRRPKKPDELKQKRGKRP